MEIGGYIELDTYSLPMLHSDGMALNCARNALAYILRVRKIKTIYIPRFLCASVSKVCEREYVLIHEYSINSDFSFPHIDLGDEEWLYFVNYYGQFGNDYIEQLKERYGGRVIIDNVQAYYQEPIDSVDTIYSCRKYFGVADGAVLYCNKQINEVILQDKSFDRMEHLLGRYENEANKFYSKYVGNDAHFEDEPIKRMSKLTFNLLHGIDYEQVRIQRDRNYAFLYKNLNEINKLQLIIPKAPYMYPLYIENGAVVRERLMRDRIYIPILWRDVLDNAGTTETEKDMALNILPLPVDQRYTEREMGIIVAKIMEYI